MDTFKSFEGVLSTVNERNFEDIAVRLFRFQVANNPVYGEYAAHLKRTNANSIGEIPFLPISFFKSHAIQTGLWTPETIFTSSGTGSQIVSRHLIKSVHSYREHTEKIFTRFFGPPEDYQILALLPSYLERDGSSLVVMADHFIRKNKSGYSGFYLNDYEALGNRLEELRGSGKKIIVLGVTFALLDLAERSTMDLSHCQIVETGGMKGRRPELTRQEVHELLCARFNVPSILSEYGMTELMSQAYSFGKGRFFTPAPMKIVIRDVNDPLERLDRDQTGAINVIDLANLYSCAFIETQDLGKTHQDGSFEVLGRMDNSDIRGCNLLVE